MKSETQFALLLYTSDPLKKKKKEPLPQFKRNMTFNLRKNLFCKTDLRVHFFCFYNFLVGIQCILFYIFFFTLREWPNIGRNVLRFVQQEVTHY